MKIVLATVLLYFVLPPVTSHATINLAEGSSYSFGGTILGQYKTHTFTVTNTGTQNASQVLGTSLTGAFSYNGGSYPGTGGTCLSGVVLTTGQSCTFIVKFSPTSSGSFSKTLTINYYDGPKKSKITVSLSGTGQTAAVLSISNAPSYDFGPVAGGQSATHLFQLTNSGQATASAIQASALSTPFQYTNGSFPGGGTCETSLAGGANCTFNVSFIPLWGGAQTSSIQISYDNGFQTNDTSIQISGTGTGIGIAPQITAAALSDNEIQLNWTDPNTSESGYWIDRAKDISGAPGAWSSIALLPSNSTSHTDMALEANTLYWYRIRAEGLLVSDNSISVATLPEQPCVPGAVLDGDTGLYHNAGLGIREPGSDRYIYGYNHSGGTNLPLPRCNASKGLIVRYPVLMIDWSDFNPVTDPVIVGGTVTFPNYVPTTPAQMSTFLNGTNGVKEYFRDVSGGTLNINFEVFDWIRATPNGYLKQRSQYLESNGNYCQGGRYLVEDALRDAIIGQGFNPSHYDADGNSAMDGLALIVEGHDSYCPGTNMAPALGLRMSDHTPLYMTDTADLVSPTHPNANLFQSTNSQFPWFINIPEYSHAFDNIMVPGVWNHELGHNLLGFPDYDQSNGYYNSWGLSSSANVSHPSALEKWAFGKWLLPKNISSSGRYVLSANEIPDGTTYSSGPYLYTIRLGSEAEPYWLAIEYRWFSSSGNTASRWAEGYSKESGLMITKLDYRTSNSSTAPQVLRYYPPRAGYYMNLTYKLGDSFSQCFGSKCISIQPLSNSLGDKMWFDITVSE